MNPKSKIGAHTNKRSLRREQRDYTILFRIRSGPIDLGRASAPTFRAKVVLEGASHAQCRGRRVSGRDDKWIGVGTEYRGPSPYKPPSVPIIIQPGARATLYGSLHMISIASFDRYVLLQDPGEAGGMFDPRRGKNRRKCSALSAASLVRNLVRDHGKSTPGGANQCI